MKDPIAYTYEADTHCPDCCRERFGNDYGDNVETLDNEGNHVGAVWGWDQWYETGCGDQTLGCGTCHCEIDKYVEE